MKKYIPQLFVLVVVTYLLFLIRPALLGQLTGTFQSHPVPQDYSKLEEFLSSQNTFSRTVWVPTTQRFGYFSSVHPAISAEDLFHVASVAGVLDILQQPLTEKTLQNAGVRHVIVPYDSEGEIFLKDRKYDNAMYQQTVKDVQEIAWLREMPGFGKIHVFEVPQPKDHFFLLGQGNLVYKFVNPTKYEIALRNVQKGEILVFSEGYDKYWQASTIQSQPFDNMFNSFVLPRDGTYTLIVEYTPQRLVTIGLWVSGITLVSIFVILIWLGRRKMLK